MEPFPICKVLHLSVLTSFSQSCLFLQQIKGLWVRAQLEGEFVTNSRGLVILLDTFVLTLLGNVKIKWNIDTSFCGLLRISELYESPFQNVVRFFKKTNVALSVDCTLCCPENFWMYNERILQRCLLVILRRSLSKWPVSFRMIRNILSLEVKF